MWTLISLAIAVIVVTSIELAFRYQRLPLGDDRCKAIWWWITVAIMDMIVGFLVFYGFIAAGILQKYGLNINSNKNDPLAVGAVIGLIGPLALRSQVATKKIAGKDSPVGITYVYDVVRINALYALDERMVRLKRRDVRERRYKWITLGLDAEIVAAEFLHHLDDHEHISEDRLEMLKSHISLILDVRDDESVRLDAIIKFLKKERFGALVDELDRYRIPAENGEHSPNSELSPIHAA